MKVLRIIDQRFAMVGKWERDEFRSCKPAVDLTKKNGIRERRVVA
jgi:hypothetical protein